MPVWITTNSTCEPGTVVSPAGTPRSYIVEITNGQVRKTNRTLSHYQLSSTHVLHAVVLPRSDQELVQ